MRDANTLNPMTTAFAAARPKPRAPLSILLAVFWINLFLRTGVTDADRNTFYVANILGPLFQAIGPGVLLCMALLLVYEFRRVFYREFLPVYLLIGAVVTLFVFSFVADGMAAVNAAQFLFGYLQYVILIPFTIVCFKEEPFDFQHLTKWVLGPILVQFAINFGWLLHINPLQNLRREIPNNVDWAYGTLTNTAEIAGIAAIPIIFAFHILVFKPAHAATYSRLRLYGLIAAGFLLMLWADSKLTYLTVSMAIGIISFLTMKASIVRKLAYTASGFALLSGMFLASIYYNYLFNPVYSSSMTYGLVVDVTLAHATRGFQNNPKIQVYQDINEKLPKDLDFPILGGGPGNATSRFAIKNSTPLANKYIVPKIEWEFNHGNSMLTLPNTGFNAVLGDLGWPGAILYYSTLLYLLISVFMKFMKDHFSGLQSTWAFVYMVFATYFILHSFIDDKMYLGTEVAFVWVMGPLLLHKGRASATDASLESRA